MGSYNHILFHQAVSATIPQGRDAGRAYLVAKASGRETRCHCPSQVGIEEGSGG
jgi:hypothetical protein